MNYDVRGKNVYFTRALAEAVAVRHESGAKETEIARALQVDRSVVRLALRHRRGNIDFNPLCFCYSSFGFLDLSDGGIAIARRIALPDDLPPRERSAEAFGRPHGGGESSEGGTPARNPLEPREPSLFERVESILETFQFLPFETLYAHIRSLRVSPASSPAGASASESSSSASAAPPSFQTKIAFRRALKAMGWTVFEGAVLPCLAPPMLEWRRFLSDSVLAHSENTLILSQCLIEMPVSLTGRAYISKSPKENSLLLVAGISAQGLSSLLVYDEESTKDRESFCLNITQNLLPGTRLLLRSDATPSLLAVDVENVLYPAMVLEALRQGFNGSVAALPGSCSDLNPMREVWGRLLSGVRPELFCYSKAHSLIRTLRIQWAEMRANRPSISSCWGRFARGCQQVARAKGNYSKSHFQEMMSDRRTDWAGSEQAPAGAPAARAAAPQAPAAVAVGDD